jgi:hypothetical protein
VRQVTPAIQQTADAHQRTCQLVQTAPTIQENVWEMELAVSGALSGHQQAGLQPLKKAFDCSIKL